MPLHPLISDHDSIERCGQILRLAVFARLEGRVRYDYDEMPRVLHDVLVDELGEDWVAAELPIERLQKLVIDVKSRPISSNVSLLQQQYLTFIWQKHADLVVELLVTEIESRHQQLLLDELRRC